MRPSVQLSQSGEAAQPTANQALTNENSPPPPFTNAMAEGVLLRCYSPLLTTSDIAVFIIHPFGYYFAAECHTLELLKTVADTDRNRRSAKT